MITIRRASILLTVLVLLLSALLLQPPPVPSPIILIVTSLSFLFAVLSAAYIRLFENIVQNVELHGIKVSDQLKRDFVGGCMITILLAAVELISSAVYIFIQHRAISLVILSLPIPIVATFIVITVFIYMLNSVVRSSLIT